MIDKIDFTEVGNRIKKYREAQHLTQAELAEMVGTNQKHLSRIECGYHSVNLNTIAAIAKALNVSIDSLSAEFNENPNENAIHEILNDIRDMNETQLELLKDNIHTLKKLNK
ncbi:MAG: helix-turn-helix transcriptional regulator [Clostridia bacterium]|nr:helix-turn-helix transcriptional regulator [Clostridia bacterium]MCI8979864.1 helix-turn-helix transcriptional regulator [Clostridia bacterium]